MAHEFARLARRQPTFGTARSVNPALTPVDPAILDPDVAARLGKQVRPGRPWISERDLLDAMMTFALVFTGAMVFLL